MIQNGTWICCVRQQPTFSYLSGMMPNTFEPCSERADDTSLQPRRSTDQFRRCLFPLKNRPEQALISNPGDRPDCTLQNVPKRTVDPIVSLSHQSPDRALISLSRPEAPPDKKCSRKNRGS